MKKLNSLIALLLCCEFIFSACGGNGKSGIHSSATLDTSTESSIGSDNSDSSTQKPSTNAILSVSEFSEPVSLLSAAATTYFNSDFNVVLHDAIANHTEMDKDKAEGVTISYSLANLAESEEVTRAQATIYEHGSTTAWKTVSFAKGKNSIVVYNCKADFTYDFSIRIRLSSKAELTETGSFTTEDTVRMMRIDGIHNVRDVGGYTTFSGKKIRQGLFYRGTELDGVHEAKYKLTEAGISEMKNVLGIVFDMDLRENNMANTNILGCTYKVYDAKHYDSIWGAPGTTAMKEVFVDIANPNNYPMYAHCTYGKDRTGTVCFMLGALLGMNEEDLTRDFELSGLMDNSTHNRNFPFMTFLSNFKAYGTTLQNAAENYLRNVGVTQAQINSIKNIFLED